MAFDADHVTHIGKAGWQDWNLVRYSVGQDYTIVTNNRRDFLKQYAKLEIHGGLVVLIPRVKRDDQIRLFARALEFFTASNDNLINALAEVLSDDNMRSWYAEDHDIGHIATPEWR